MGTSKVKGDYAFRDFIIDGAAGSGYNAPKKSEIRDFVDDIDARVSAIDGTQAASAVLIGPVGASGTSSFRPLTPADIPVLTAANLPAGIAGGMTFDGGWNASSNSPALASGVGVSGHYRVVAVAGTTTLDGVSTWNAGDYAIFSGGVWQRVQMSNPATIVRAANIAALRAMTPATAYDVLVSCGTTTGDGLGGHYYGVTGASVGTYVNDGVTVVLPTGGNGSAAWLRNFELPMPLPPIDVRKFAVDLYNNVAVVIDCFGDSTCWGADPANTVNQVAEPSPARLQNFLRAYFGNNAATVNNKGVSGSRTSQMLNGTDGSGLTFEARLAASSAQIIYVNHGINDAQNVPPTGIAQYKTNLHEIARLVRFYGKALVFVTPNIILPFGIGTDLKAETLKDYADCMRQVAADLGVPLVDANYYSTKIIEGGKYKATDIIGDGVHPSAIGYQAIGSLYAQPFIFPGRRGLSAPDSFIPASDPTILCTDTGSATITPNTRFGASRITGSSGAMAIQAAVLIEEAGMDVYIAHPIWAYGSNAVSINADLIPLTTNYSMQDSNMGSTFPQDHEIYVIENADPGLHLISLTTSAGGIGLSHVRTRATLKPRKLFLGNSSGASVGNGHVTLMSAYYHTVSGAGNVGVVLFDDIPTSRFLRTLDIEMYAALNASEGMMIGGCVIADNASSVNASAGIVIGLNASGYLTVSEINGSGGMTDHVIGSTNLSGASHYYRASVTGGRFGVVTPYLDGVAQTPVSLTLPYLGGLLGLRKVGAGTMSVTEIRRYI